MDRTPSAFLRHSCNATVEIALGADLRFAGVAIGIASPSPPSTLPHMKKTLLTLTVIAAVSGLSLAAGKAKTPVADHQIGQFKIGAHITGPEVSEADLNGKAVLIDAWGIHCGP